MTTSTPEAVPAVTLLLDGAVVRVRRCRHGPMAYLRQDAYVGRSLDLYGEYGEDEQAVLAQMVRPGDVVVEAGANLGTHTVPLARKVGPSGALIAFEPQRVVFQILCANVALNELTNVHAQNAAVGETPGSARSAGDRLCGGQQFRRRVARWRQLGHGESRRAGREGAGGHH